MLLIYILIFILLLSLFYKHSINFLFSNTNQSFISPINVRSNIEFLSEFETRDFLDRDHDKYIDSLTKADLHARGCESGQLYKQRCCMSAGDCSSTGLKQAIYAADSWFRSKSDVIKSHGIDCERICSLPWRIAIVRGKIYENGLPHTRGDVIFLSDQYISGINIKDSDIVKTLIHEKVHIYQRAFLKEIQEYLEGLGYIRGGLAHGIYPLARSNPDTDGYVYLRPGDRKPMVALYRTDKPVSISDIISSPLSEHPFEKMAYDIDKLYSN